MMKRITICNLSISTQTMVLICIFAFLLGRLLFGCDREPETAPASFQLGGKAPDFAAKDLDGNVTVLSSLHGSPVILRFFETNCQFCKADTPIFTEFYKKHQDKGLKVLYIGSYYDSEKSLRAFTGELRTVFPVILDNGAKLADQYGIRAYPQTVFLSPEGKILAALLGAVGEAELVENIGKYL